MLKLFVSNGRVLPFGPLAEQLAMSASEVHASVGRATAARLPELLNRLRLPPNDWEARGGERIGDGQFLDRGYVLDRETKLLNLQLNQVLGLAAFESRFEHGLNIIVIEYQYQLFMLLPFLSERQPAPGFVRPMSTDDDAKQADATRL